MEASASSRESTSVDSIASDSVAIQAPVFSAIRVKATHTEA